MKLKLASGIMRLRLTKEEILYLFGIIVEEGVASWIETEVERPRKAQEISDIIKRLLNRTSERDLREDLDFNLSLQLSLFRVISEGGDWKSEFRRKLRAIFPEPLASKLYGLAQNSIGIKRGLKSSLMTPPTVEEILEFRKRRLSALGKIIKRLCDHQVSVG